MKTLLDFDFAKFESKGNAYCNNRFIYGARQEWEQPGTYEGRPCRAVYSFSAEEIKAAEAINGEEDLPWDAEHCVRIEIEEEEVAMKRDYFRTDNTEGYTQQQLEELNKRLTSAIASQKLDQQEDLEEIKHLAEQIQQSYDSEIAG